MGIVQALTTGELDAGILWTPVLNPMGAEFQVLQPDTLIAALPQSHPLARASRLRLADLAAEPFILYDAVQGEGMRSVCMMACQRAGFVPRAAQEAVQVRTVLTLMESGLGIALIPSLMQAAAGAAAVCRPVVDLDEPLIGLALAYRPHGAHPTVDALRESATAECPRNQANAAEREERRIGLVVALDWSGAREFRANMELPTRSNESFGSSTPPTDRGEEGEDAGRFRRISRDGRRRG